MITACDNDSADITVTELKLKYTGQGDVGMISIPIDINADSHSDFRFSFAKSTGGDFYITIQRLLSFEQEPNPFNPMVFIDADASDIQVGNVDTHKRVDFFRNGQMIWEYVTDDFGRAFLLAENRFEPKGTKYISVALEQSGDIYYGWIELEFDENTFAVKRIGLNNTSGKKIRAGQR